MTTAQWLTLLRCPYSTEFLMSNYNYDSSIVDQPHGSCQNLSCSNQCHIFSLPGQSDMFLYHTQDFQHPLYQMSLNECILATSAGSLNSPLWIQTMVTQPNLSSPLKFIFMHAKLLSYAIVLIAQEKNLFTHCQVSISYVSYNTHGMRCFHFCPATILVSKSAGLSS